MLSLPRLIQQEFRDFVAKFSLTRHNQDGKLFAKARNHMDFGMMKNKKLT